VCFGVSSAVSFLPVAQAGQVLSRQKADGEQEFLARENKFVLIFAFSASHPV